MHGSSGIGKSTLLRRFALDERTRGGPCLVLQGRCFEQESVPHKALDGIVDELARRLRRLPTADREALLPRDLPALAALFPVMEGLSEVGAPPLATASTQEIQDSSNLF